MDQNKKRSNTVNPSDVGFRERLRTRWEISGALPLTILLTPLQMEMVTQLRAESGMARDAAYIAPQKAAHNGALNVRKAYAMEGTAPALRRAAGGIVPVVENHIAMLMKM